MEFKFNDEMQKAVDKFANDELLAEYEKSLSIESFSETKKSRKRIAGVYHKDGKLIATNGYILIAVKENYEKELEGLKVSARFDLTDEEKREFISWEKGIPQTDDSKIEVFTDDDFTQLEKLAVVSQIISNRRKGFDGIAFVAIGEAFFNAKYVFMFCVMAKKYGLHNVCLDCCPNLPRAKPLRIFGDNGDIALMPLIKDDDEIYCDFDNSQKFEVERYTEEIGEVKNPFNFEVRKFKPRIVDVKEKIEPYDCPNYEDDCTNCPYNMNYNKGGECVTCSYDE